MKLKLILFPVVVLYIHCVITVKQNFLFVSNFMRKLRCTCAYDFDIVTYSSVNLVRNKPVIFFKNFKDLITNYCIILQNGNIQTISLKFLLNKKMIAV